jgi:hypothetical protein
MIALEAIRLGAEVAEDCTKALAPKMETQIADFVAKNLGENIARKINGVVNTIDPERFFLRLPQYENDSAVAHGVEQIIGNARDSVLAGKLNSAKELEKFISSRYIPEVHPYRDPPFSRVDETTGAARPFLDPYLNTPLGYRSPMMSKHVPYSERALALVGQNKEHVMTARLNGQEVEFVKTAGYSLPAPWLFAKPWWTAPEHAQAFKAAGLRSEELWNEIIDSRRLPPTPERLHRTVEQVAETEWLGAQTWKYYNGSAGTAQAVSRTLLEVSGIDSVRFKVGIDPNLEALTTPLSQYVRNYIHFFEQTPHYF